MTECNISSRFIQPHSDPHSSGDDSDSDSESSSGWERESAAVRSMREEGERERACGEVCREAGGERERGRE